VEIGKENYPAIKKRILKEVTDEIEKTKKFRYSIYNLKKH